MMMFNLEEELRLWKGSFASTQALGSADIEELRSTGLSLMPEGLEKQLNPQQLADVIEFILKQ